MTESLETYLRWEPLPDLPEHPFASMDLTWTGEGLGVTADYYGDPPARGVRFVFGRVPAFKVYEEFSDPWMEGRLPLPLIRNPKLRRYVWPLLEVHNSHWIARVVARNGGLEGYPWRHLEVVTLDMTLHIMTASDPDLVELIV